MSLIQEELKSKGIKEENIISINLDKRPFIHIRKPIELEKAIEEKIEKRYREVSKMNLYKKLAESDEEIRELVKELESIN